VLIYIASLSLQSVTNMIINNQCSNIELTSPVYFTKNTMCYIHLPQKVDSESRIEANFRTSLDRSTFGGALLYHLQRKENNESDKDTSVSTQLLVIWGYNYQGVYLHTWLIEHESTLIWNEDKLERLYNGYDSQYNMYSDLDIRDWSLDDNTTLKTEFGSSHGDFEMEVNISEEEYPFLPIKPMWIDSNK
jgi:hypothetical protein